MREKQTDQAPLDETGNRAGEKVKTFTRIMAGVLVISAMLTSALAAEEETKMQATSLSIHKKHHGPQRRGRTK